MQERENGPPEKCTGPIHLHPNTILTCRYKTQDMAIYKQLAVHLTLNTIEEIQYPHLI